MIDRPTLGVVESLYLTPWSCESVTEALTVCGDDMVAASCDSEKFAMNIERTH